MFKNENVKSPRGLSKRLFLASSVDFSSEKTAKLNTTKSAATLSRINVTLLRKKNAQRGLRQSVRLSTRSSVRLFKMRSVRMFHQNNVVLLMIGSAQRFPNRNAGML